MHDVTEKDVVPPPIIQSDITCIAIDNHFHDGWYRFVTSKEVSGTKKVAC
jgi:hypothetical protein